MKHYRALYLVHNKVIGESEFVAHIQPNSVAYVCSTCGELWGRIFVRDDDLIQHWEIDSVPCHRHLPRGVPDWSRVPGGFLIGAGQLTKSDLRVTAWARAIEHLPESVLKREFDLTEAHYQRKQNEQDHP